MEEDARAAERSHGKHRRYGRLAISCGACSPAHLLQREEMTAEGREESTDKCRGEMAEDRPTLQQQQRSSGVAAWSQRKACEPLPCRQVSRNLGGVLGWLGFICNLRGKRAREAVQESWRLSAGCLD